MAIVLVSGTSNVADLNYFEDGRFVHLLIFDLSYFEDGSLGIYCVADLSYFEDGSLGSVFERLERCRF